MLKAVLFDLDDTLIDWSGFHGDWSRMELQNLRNVVNFIRSNGHALNDVDVYATEFRMRTMDAWTAARTSLRAPNLGAILIETAVALGVPPGALDARQILEVYGWNAVPGTRMFPDVPGALMQLHRRRIKVGIVTNAYQPMWIRDTEIATHGILQHFPDCRISAADVGYLKPHPAIFQIALNCLDVKPNEAVFVGDDPDADIGGAEAAGLYAVLRYAPGREAEIEPSIAPDARVTSLVQLLPILDRWFPGWR
ncbi:MAG: HAD family hydrolase [Anaerolineae bacterium]|nr:HAD family hydrolase [Anaerolineae bacterium]